MTCCQKPVGVKYNHFSDAAVCANKDDKKSRCCSHFGEAIPESRRQIVKKVYFIIFAQLLASALAGFLCFHLMRIEAVQKHKKCLLIIANTILHPGSYLFWGAIMLCPNLTFPKSCIAVLACTLFMSSSIGLSIVTRNGPEALLLSFGITAGLFLSLTLFSSITKSFAGKGPYIFVAIFVLMLFVLGATAFGSFWDGNGSTDQSGPFVTSFPLLVLASLALVYNMQQLLSEETDESIFDENDHVFPTFILYLMIITVFALTLCGPLRGLPLDS